MQNKRSLYMPRTYRDAHAPDGLQAFSLCQEQSDLYIAATHPNPAAAERALTQARAEVFEALRMAPEFGASLVPLDFIGPALPTAMARACAACGVGPMAAVAGAVAQAVGQSQDGEVIVENGGDLYLHLTRSRVIGLFAGDKSPFSGRLGLHIGPGTWGLCTSSGTLGHSLSFGRADAAVILSADPLLADAAATALGNQITTPDQAAPAVEQITKLPGILGAVAIIGTTLAAVGAVELVKLAPT